MKIFTQGIFARRKIVLLFLLAILLPSLVVGYLSFRTFSEKQKAVQNFLESNLWISGESALKAIEDELLDLEKASLKKENFVRWIQFETPIESLSEVLAASEEMGGKLFLLDENFKIVLPQTARIDTSYVELGKDLTDSQFSQTLQTAETLEFAQRDYSRALEGYSRCLSVATSEHQKALVLEAMGRCFLVLESYDKAYKTYSELSTDYSRLLNKAGHPYGLTANMQLFEIGRYLDNKDKALGILLRLYENLQNGEYHITLSAYEFFVNEIQTILDAELEKGEFQEMLESFKNLKSKGSSYLETLLYVNFLKREVIPKMTERRSLNRLQEDTPIGRFLTSENENYCLVSFSIFPDFQDKKTFFGGICWDLGSFKTEIFPMVLREVEKNTKLQLRIIDDKGQNVLTGKEESAFEEALSLSFRQFPLPWSLVVTQPALDDVLRATRRDNVFYGVLLGFVVVLMLFGAILIARDISRETETTRLKTEFVHHVSHELKTPLTLIRLYGETLQRKKDLSRAEQKEAYEIITKESERLSHLINNVLDFSRIEMGKKEFDFKKGNLAGVIRDTLESYRYHLEKKGFLIQEYIADGLPEMTFDTEAIASVLINLLSNAIKFSPTTKEVSIKLFKEDNHAILQVIDKGIGISSKEISRVFEKFYRSKDVKAADAKGSGLGLTLVKHITEAHGGKIEVHSEPGQGSTFTIILPISGSTQG
jgi:signal transduction histidine kinase/tetratricopeptide (TPR) repeat protein